jgi:predicted lipoprotein with Yx(FWY)xxD motif
MKRAMALAGLLAAAAVGCGDGGSSKAAPAQAASTTTQATRTTAATTTAAKPKPPGGKRVTLHKSDYGKILADGRGRALYLFTHDDAKSRCYGACAKAWPPFLTKGAPRAGARVKQKLLGTVKRSDGRKQVTYHGHPLYYYVGDHEPGQVLCQAVLEYGGYWYVVKRSGEPVR